MLLFASHKTANILRPLLLAINYFNFQDVYTQENLAIDRERTFQRTLTQFIFAVNVRIKLVKTRCCNMFNLFWVFR